ncbi:MAG: dipeptide ABC transporter ATP-binding protein [Candidatus Accumulibacter sp.]|jgi:oligopeptide/dipeptide ABC transporter ATP-binding protein|nr:dipeptide ABC transporter ATP-binding protein [Accumulibacter sp.]
MSAAATGSTALLRLDKVVKRFKTGAGTVHALDGVSFFIRRGETLGLVGESGCGKSTAARLVMDLYQPTSGTVYFDGEDIAQADKAAKKARRARLQMVFQDPYSSLNPRNRVGRTLEEPLIIHARGARKERHERVAWLLERVGLKADAAERYPHEFSGGQRQRIGIARALALRPDLIVCDEAVSALDVSIRAQILNLLLDLRQDYQVAYLFISHDLAIVRHMSDRVAVMYLGKIVELASRDDLWRQPRHPYTRALMAAIPCVHPGRKRKEPLPLQGDPPSPLNPPPGCRFQSRCPFTEARCREEEPPLQARADEHWVACHRAE